MPHRSFRSFIASRSLVSAFIVSTLLLWLVPAVGHASSGPRWSSAQLADLSAAIVRGRVSSMTVEWDDSVRSIYTYVTIEVDDVLKGAIDAPRIVLKQAGGSIGGIGLEVSGQARFAIGEDVIVYTEVRPRDGTLYTTALWQGKWTVERDPRTGGPVAVQRDASITDGPTEIASRSLDAFIGEIAARAAINPATEAFVTIPPEHPVSSQADPFVTLDQPAKWTSLPALVNIQSGGQPGLSGGGMALIQNDLSQWNSAGSNFRWSLNSTSAASRCGTVYGGSGVVTIVANDPCAEISNTGGTLAVAYSWFTTAIAETVNGVGFRRLLEVTIISNDGATAQPFITNAGCYQQVMLHELGHALGLGHTAVSTAIMFATVSFSQCSAGARPLQPDDMDGVRFIYGGGGGGGGGTPGTPTNVSATAAGGVLTVSWTAPGGSPAPTAYRLTFRSGDAVVATVDTGATTAVSVAIPPGTSGTFTVTVTAFAGTTAGSPSAAATFTIGGGGGGCSSAPATPTGLTGSVSGGVASVQFNASAGATSYIVQAGSTATASDIFNGNIGNSTGASSPVGAGFQAFVRVIAVNGCGQSAATPNIFISATAGDLEITLTWDSGADVDLHIIEPSGAHVYYANRTGPTARLERDDTDGFGPETITVARGAAASGTYQIYIVHFSGAVATTATIQVRVNGGTANEQIQTFTRSSAAPSSTVGINVADANVLGRTITPRGGTRAGDERDPALVRK